MVTVACVLRIDTDGNFHVDNVDSLEEAERIDTLNSECGLASKVIERRPFIREAAGY